MTEVEATSTLVSIADLLATYLGLWVTSTFAYLTAAYFLGEKLTRFQSVVISGLYIAASLSFALAALGHTEAFILLEERELTVYRDVRTAKILDLYYPGFAFLFSSGTLISLYFMWDLRRRAEDTDGA